MFFSVFFFNFSLLHTFSIIVIVIIDISLTTVVFGQPADNEGLFIDLQQWGLQRVLGHSPESGGIEVEPSGFCYITSSFPSSFVNILCDTLDFCCNVGTK